MSVRGLILALALVALTGWGLWVTHSFWSLLILLFVATIKK